MTIEIQVNDDFVQRLGIERVRKMLQDRLDAEEFRLAADHIHQAMDEAAQEGVDWEAEFEQVRQQSWEEYQKKRSLA